MGIEIGSKRFLIFLIKAWCHRHIRVTKKQQLVSEDVSEELIDIITGERQSRQNGGLGIISKLAVGIKGFWTEDSKNNSLFKVFKDQLTVPEICEYIKVPLLNDDILKNKNIHYKRNDKK